MTYDFDKIIERRGSYSIKYAMKALGKPENALPLWVADMDFQSPPCVLDALDEQVKHGIFGYSDTGERFINALQSWFREHYDWNIERDWVVKTSGVVHSVNVALITLTKPGDAVLVQQPVYGPLNSAVLKNKRELVTNELIYENYSYRIDFDDFEKKIIDNKVKLFIMCNPHNPVGRVWTHGELTRMGEICLRNGVKVISDEIHQDFIYEGHRHLVFAGLSPELADITVSCTAPTKTFNIAGLPIANIIIKDKEMRDSFKTELSCIGSGGPGILSTVACQAAYEDGGLWLSELMSYLDGNMSLLQTFFGERQIKLVKPEGTYLAWLDFRALQLDDKQLEELLLNKAGLWLNSGSMFGSGGEGFLRLNAACPRATLVEALERMESALRSG